jgi:hypothetical protein
VRDAGKEKAVAGSLRGQYRRLGVHQKKISDRMRGWGVAGRERTR